MTDISWVLVRVSQPGNIGFCARLMSNFGYNDLRLVNCCDHLSLEAKKFSAGNEDILANATTYPGLKAALIDRDIVVATTSRVRKYQNKLLAIKRLRLELNSKAAVLFGNESSGLSNEELEYCNQHYFIPTSGQNKSLNLSHAFAIVCFQLMDESFKCSDKLNTKLDLANFSELSELKNRLLDYLHLIKFTKQAQEDVLGSKIAVILNRMELNSDETVMLNAIIGKTVSLLKKK